MAVTPDPKRAAFMAVDFQNDILGMIPYYREKNLLAVVDATARTGADPGYHAIVVAGGCASNADDHHHSFVNNLLPPIGTAATANDVIAALG